MEDSHVNFDILEEALKLFDGRIGEYLREPVKI
jgi:hypothetical protein